MGIPISVDPSWLLIFGVLTLQLSTLIFPRELGLRPRAFPNLETLALGALTSLLLFASVLAHELSHSWMALRRGIPVLGITLFIFGGVAQIGDEADRPSTEFLVAIMGPLMSLALAFVFAIFWIWPLALLRPLASFAFVLRPVMAVAYYLALTNAMLVLFNLLPGFPLDGGRVLRSILWALSHNLRRATQIAMVLGRGIAVLLVLAGLYLLLSEGFNGIWLLLVGGFLWQAAGEAYQSVVLRDMLRTVPVSGLMSVPIEAVPGELDLSSFVEQYLLHRRAAAFAVEEHGQTIGLVGDAQLRQFPRDRWSHLRVHDAMLAFSPAEAVTPEESALGVMQKLARRKGGEDGVEIPVVANGQVIGVVGHAEIARYLHWRSQRAPGAQAT